MNRALKAELARKREQERQCRFRAVDLS